MATAAAEAAKGMARLALVVVAVQAMVIVAVSGMTMVVAKK